MNTYKTITLKDGSEWACNAEREGVFSRRPDGTWQRQLGTEQTPRFASAQALSRYVHARFRASDGETLPRMTGAAGW